jgi:5-methyltetrahydropteroyltriglutamate--homocysteine methyltransferase
MSDFPEFDDVGSFPLPENIDKEKFNKFYWIAYKGFLSKTDIFSNKGIQIYFINPLIEAFKFKFNSGVQIISYPQLIDMNQQFLKPISDYEIEPDLIDPEKAVVSEMFILENFAKQFYEESGECLRIKFCITGPIELYIKKHKFTIYQDIISNLAESIKSFLKNSIISKKYFKTSIISIDEPSFGYIDLVNVDDVDLIKIFDMCLDGVNKKEITTQIHIHSLKRADIPLKTEKIDVITCEYAANRTNKISKRLLDQYDKFIRVGITRTNIDNIIAEAIDTGISWDFLKTYDGMISLIDSKERIKKNLYDALDMYQEKLRFIGPDCGLGGWRIPQVAYELLARTYNVINEVKNQVKENDI